MSNSGWEKHPNGIEMCRYEKEKGGYGARIKVGNNVAEIPYDVHLAICALSARAQPEAATNAGDVVGYSIALMAAEQGENTEIVRKGGASRVIPLTKVPEHETNAYLRNLLREANTRAATAEADLAKARSLFNYLGSFLALDPETPNEEIAERVAKCLKYTSTYSIKKAMYDYEKDK